MSIVAQRCAPRAPGASGRRELDGFNAVNDVRGYDIGDAVLVEVARRLPEPESGPVICRRGCPATSSPWSPRPRRCRRTPWRPGC